jgi:SPP1 gp7 family putative phage head morphogenesis protein
LRKQFDFTRNRARLIARDQVGKLYGQINAARQQAIGVTHFVWQTSNDERVRDEHEERNGKTYSYANPPDGELPGQPIQCRCVANPILTEAPESAIEHVPDKEKRVGRGRPVPGRF